MTEIIVLYMVSVSKDEDEGLVNSWMGMNRSNHQDTHIQYELCSN